jgi:DNA (cytosine-5)-methyltransferase 1
MVKSASVAVNAKAAVDKKVCRVPKIIRFGSDFTGLDTAAYALNRLGVRYINKFASDVLPEARQLIELAHRPEKIIVDMLGRTIPEEAQVDLYVWTPPCQDLSSAGTGSGFKGKRQTAKLVARSLAFIKRNRPRVTLFENVPRITSKKNLPFLRGIVKSLKSIGYSVYYKVLCAHDYGVPQSRERFYLVGIRADSERHTFQWPVNTDPMSASAVLDPFNAETDLPGRLPGTAKAKKLVQKAMTAVFKSGTDPRIVPVLIDIDCTDKFAVHGIDIAKTITRTRGGSGGPWVSSRGRRVTIDELFKLQGFDPNAIPWQAAKITRRQAGQLVGNSVCLPVMGMILAEALYAAGLTAKKLVWKTV